MAVTSASITFVLISLFLCLPFFYLAFLGTSLSVNRKTFLWSFFGMLLLIGIGNVFVYFFSSYEEFIYTWDYHTYWHKSIRFCVTFFYAPRRALKELYHSVLTEDYANTPCFSLAPLLYIFGKSYTSYVLSVFNMYYVPAYLLYTLLFLYLKESVKAASAIDVLFFLLFPFTLSTVLYGYIDAVGLPFMGLFIVVAFKADFTRYNWLRNISLGLLLVLFLIERRWFTFWLASYFASMAIMYLTKYFLEPKELSLAKLVAVAIQLASILGFTIGIVALFFHDFYLKTFFNKINDTYSAYHSGSWTVPMEKTFLYLGPLFILLGVIGVCCGFSQKRTKYFTLFLVAHFVFSYCAFTYFQDFGIHQYLLLASTWVVLCKLGFDGLLSLLIKQRYKLIFQVAIIILLLGQCCFIYLPKASPYFEPLSFAFSNTQLFPRQRSDISSVKDLVYYVQSISSCPPKKIYAIGSSSTFNDQVVQNLLMPKEYHPVSMLLKSRDVDKRDGFPSEALKAEIIILAWPIQYHLRPEDQMSVIEIGKLVEQNSGPGRSYCLLKTFPLENEVEARVYEKVNPIPFKSIEQLKSKFLLRYSGYPQLTDFGGL